MASQCADDINIHQSVRLTISNFLPNTHVGYFSSASEILARISTEGLLSDHGALVFSAIGNIDSVLRTLDAGKQQLH